MKKNLTFLIGALSSGGAEHQLSVLCNLLADDYDLMGCDRGMCTLLKGGYAERIRQAADQAITAYGMPLETSANTKV